MIGRYCGDSIPPSHVLSSNEVLIHFQSDSSTPNSGTGFKMEYIPTGKQNTSIKKSTLYHIDVDTKFWVHSSFQGTFMFFVENFSSNEGQSFFP